MIQNLDFLKVNTVCINNPIYHIIVSSPDSFGNVAPEMKPVRHLAWVACGYIIWQNSTENTWYKMVKIQTVKQVVSDFYKIYY